MSDAVIQVSGLGKKYLLRHQQEGRRYKALRDVIADGAKSFFQNRKIETENRKTVEEFWALHDVSFEVKRGDVVGIIGRNGAGKSTLLKLLSRITEPSKGSIRLRGRVASLLEVGTGFHPELTGRENIFLNGAILGMARIEIAKKFDEIVAFAEIEKFLDTPVKRYSSGMYMRLAFAVAAHLEPEILIVDEVLAVGDAAFQKKCLGKMQDVSKGGRTVLFVSHNMAAVQQLCNHGLLLEKGTVVENGEASLVVQTYTSRSTSRSESLVQLEATRRFSWLDLRVKLISFNVNDGRPLFYGESCEFILEFEGSAAFEEVWFAVGFSGPDGMRYATYDSHVAQGMIAVKQEKKMVRLQIDRLLLQPGIYLLDLGVALGNTSSASDYLPGAVQVEVLPGEKTPSYLCNGICGVRLEGKWNLAS